MFRAALFAAAVIAASPACAQQPGDYLDVSTQAFVRMSDQATKTIRRLYFAVGCKVVWMGAPDRMADHLRQHVIDEFVRLSAGYINANIRPPFNIGVVFFDLDNAVAEGWAAARSGCQWWHDHPEAVMWVRRLPGAQW